LKKFDYIIIGQGIAGTLMSWFLTNRNRKVLVVDQFNPTSSSLVAAGIFNPITGRRFVKTWLADEIFPFAEKTYRELERHLDCKFYYPKPILRKLTGDLEKKEWKQKRKLPEYKHYLGEESQDGSVTIRHGGYVDFIILLQAYRERLRNENRIVENVFNYKDLVLGRKSLSWKEFTAEKIIFCEGHRVIDNPFFESLPFTFAKGEILTLRTDSLVGVQTNSGDEIISSGIFILPIGDNLFRVGATYNWEDRSERPTDEGKKELVEKLEKLIGNNYEIVDHKAGIRPTVIDRRPLLGMHEEFNHIGIFNGLGTKGASLGPYFASHFCSHLEEENNLMSEVSITRFEKQKIKNHHPETE
jgi:glycine/D-amino acid oxidase-like deaminating enzyme